MTDKTYSARCDTPAFSLESSGFANEEDARADIEEGIARWIDILDLDITPQSVDIEVVEGEFASDDDEETR